VCDGFKHTDVESTTLIFERAGFGKDGEKRGDEQGKGEIVQRLEGHNLNRKVRARVRRGVK
jgi:hypothetical protein